ncbi:MAG: DUF6049 family protein [Rhodoglobus sp.]|nr:DUF6049 family protein [Rhodoglobus sp.]
MLAERTRALRAALALTIGLAAAATGVTASAQTAAAVGESTTTLVVIVPISTPESEDAFIPADALEQYTSPQGLLTRQLDAVLALPVTIAIDPRILASIRVLGSSAPATATAWLARLEAASNETFALTYGDSDITLATQAGSSRVLAPNSFDFAIDDTLFVDPPEQTPASTATPEPPVVPTSDSLVDWAYSVAAVAWPRAGTVVESDLQVMSDSGYGTVILSSNNVAAGSPPVARVGEMTAVIADDGVSGAVRAAATSRSASDWQAAIAALAALLTPGTTVVTLDRSVPLAANQRAETLVALQAMSNVTLGRLGDLVSSEATTIVDRPQDAAALDRVRLLLDAEREEVKFASVAAEPSDVTSPRRLRELTILSIAWTDNPNGWSTATQQFLLDSIELRNAVQLVSSSSFLLLADSSGLPVSVSNALGQPVTVFITVRPETALLAVGDSRVELVIEPHSQAKGVVPVQAISNGTVQILTTLTSSTGVAIGQPTTAEINVQAGWETPVVSVIGALVVAVFAGGIVRNIVRRRRGVRQE